uniref:non-specific serine/threonine protein kinase n=1 Tax=Chlamydomonas euryale TaxID=1486919 RepID=A0A7R9Z4D4_9CHLO
MDKYKVIKRIGVGTYGSAYLVASTADANELFVLKKVKLDEANEKERVQAETEVEVLRALDHPLVLSYVDHFLYRGHLCIVTEYCEGGDLAQLLRSRKSPLLEGQILELLTQILMALQYMHGKGILHRDLKTANIFLTKDGSIKLGDFGISRSLSSSLDLAQTIIGTPYYMSPEVMSSQPYDFKSDMWSLGCCLYEMMTLKHAFDATDLTSLVLKVMRGEHLPIPDTFSMALRDTAKQLLSKIPKMRPTPEQCLKSPLLKDFTFRIRERVAYLEQRVSTRRRSPTQRPLHNTSDLDKELAQAQERLRKIKAERDALRGQIASSSSATAAGGDQVSPLKRRDSSPDPTAEALRRQHHQQVSLEQQGRRRSAGLGGVPPPVPTRHRVSCGGTQPSDDAAFGSPPTGLHGSHSATDPKARKEARRQEEIRKREAELLEARKSYFEARRNAEAQKWQMYHGGTVGSPPVLGSHTGTAHTGGTAGGTMRAGSTSNGGGLSAHPAGYHSTPNPPLASDVAGLSLDDSDDDFYTSDARGNPGVIADPSAAMQEFEQELRGTAAGAGGGMQVPLELLSSYNVGAAMQDRVVALRAYCTNALGPQLFDLIYGQLRRRVSGGPASDEHVFRQELQARLGPSRMQCVQLIDQLIFFEDTTIRR